MTYNITKSDGTPLVVIPDMTLDNRTTSLTLIGKDSVNYGEVFSQDFVNLLDRFYNAAGPINPLQGQLWYDSNVSKLKVFNGTNWEIVSPAFDGVSGTVVLTLPTAPAAGVVLSIADNKIISVTTSQPFNQVYLQDNVAIDGQNYEFKSRFPNGLLSGVNLATDPIEVYRFHGIASSANVLTTSRMISLTGQVRGNVMFDGLTDANIIATFSNVYIGNTNVSVSGTWSNATISSNGAVLSVGNITVNDITSALGYLPYSDANVNTAAVGNTVVLRDQYGSFAANAMAGTSTYTMKFVKSSNISLDGDVIGSAAFDGSANTVINGQRAIVSNLTAGVFNSVTVNDQGIVQSGVLTELMPVGAIVLYNNSVVIPEGWAKCNGSNVQTPQGVTITTPNLSNVLVGSSFYIMKAWNDLDLPSNDTIVGTISVDLTGGGVPTIFLVGGPNVPYPPLVWSNVNVSSSGNTVTGNVTVKIHSARCTHKGKNYQSGDKLYVDLPTFDKGSSRKGCIRVDAVHSGNGAIKDYTLTYEGKYCFIPNSGNYGIWVTGTDYSQIPRNPGNNGFSPIGQVPLRLLWEGIPGLRNNKPKRNNNDKDNEKSAIFDITATTDSDNIKFVVPDVNFGDDLYFDAVALILTNGDPNSVMLSQTNLYGDLSQLTVAQVMKNLETRIISALPPRVGMYMLSYDDIIHHAGYLKCPVDTTYFTIAFQRQIMLLTTSDNASRFAYSGIYPSDDKLFGAAYIGFVRYIALLQGPKDQSVGDVLVAANLGKTNIADLDDLKTSEFLLYVSKMITNAKIAVANNRVAIRVAELVNNNTKSKNNIPVPDPILPLPLLTTGNASILISEAMIDGLPAVVGGTRGEPSYGGGSYINSGADTNKSSYTKINNTRYNLGGNGGNGSGNNSDIDPGGGVSYDTGTGTKTGTRVPNVNPSQDATAGTYQSGDGFLGNYAGAESGGKVVWNYNGAANYKSVYGYAPPNPVGLTVGTIKAEQQKMIDANAAVSRKLKAQGKPVPAASSAVGPIQQIAANFSDSVAKANIPDTAIYQGETINKIAGAAFDDTLNAVAAKLNVSVSEVTAGQAGMGLSYGAGMTAAITKAAAVNPTQTAEQFRIANGYSYEEMYNNPPCTPGGELTPIGAIETFCADFHKLDQYSSAIAAPGSVIGDPITDLQSAIGLVEPAATAIAATAVITQTTLVDTAAAVTALGVSRSLAAEVNTVLNGQGIQTTNGNGTSPAAVGTDTPSSNKTGYRSDNTSYQANYNRDRQSNGGSIGVGVRPGQPNTTGNNKGTNATGTGPGNEVGSAKGAGPYSNGGGAGASFNSGGSTQPGGPNAGAPTGVGGAKTGGSGTSTGIQACHVGSVKVTMADGSFKQIRDIKVGDKIRGMDSINTVTRVRQLSLSSKLVKFNGSDFFVSDSHPMLTRTGWGSFETTRSNQVLSKVNRYMKDQNLGKDMTTILPGTEIAKLVDGKITYVPVTGVSFEDRPNTPVYVLSTDGDHTYVTDGYLSHNKA